MKRCTQDCEPYFTEDGEFFQFNLGWNYKAEHEMGIGHLKHKFGISSSDSDFGIERRRITKIPDFLYLYEDEKEAATYLAFTGYCHGASGIPSGSVREETQQWLDEEYAAAWDECEFAIAAHEDPHRDHLRKLHEAFLAKDVAIWVGGSVNPYPFANGGLQITIISDLPEKYAAILEDDDRAQYRENYHARDLTDPETQALAKNAIEQGR